jgi:hypothetical protein
MNFRESVAKLSIWELVVNLEVVYEKGGDNAQIWKANNLHIWMNGIDSNVSLKSLGVPTP